MTPEAIRQRASLFLGCWEGLRERTHVEKILGPAAPEMKGPRQMEQGSGAVPETLPCVEKNGVSLAECSSGWQFAAQGSLMGLSTIHFPRVVYGLD
ncbi:hypothetical protein AAY473_029672 [Plecturocebus cupreus]